jgi:hypothetical protein
MNNLPIPEWMFDALVSRGAEKLREAGLGFGSEDQPMPEEQIRGDLLAAVTDGIIDAGEAFALAALAPDMVAVAVAAAETATAAPSGEGRGMTMSTDDSNSLTAEHLMRVQLAIRELLDALPEILDDPIYADADLHMRALGQALAFLVLQHAPLSLAVKIDLQLSVAQIIAKAGQPPPRAAELMDKLTRDVVQSMLPGTRQ